MDKNSVNLVELLDLGFVTPVVDAVISIIGEYVAPGTQPDGYPDGFYGFPLCEGTVSVFVDSELDGDELNSTIIGILISNGQLVLIGELPDADDYMTFKFTEDEKVNADIIITHDNVNVTTKLIDAIPGLLGDLLVADEADQMDQMSSTGLALVPLDNDFSQLSRSLASMEFRNAFSGETMLVGLFDYTGVPNVIVDDVEPPTIVPCGMLILLIVPVEFLNFTSTPTASNTLLTTINHELDLTINAAFNKIGSEHQPNFRELLASVNLDYPSNEHTSEAIQAWIAHDLRPNSFKTVFGEARLVAPPFIGKDLAAAIEGFDSLDDAIKSVAVGTGMQTAAIAINPPVVL